MMAGLVKVAEKVTRQTNKLLTCFSETKLDSKFKIKENLAKEHKHGVIYRFKCPSERCKFDHGSNSVIHLG